MRRNRKTREMRRIEEESGELIETLIERLHDEGKTQAEIAARFGVSRSTFNLWLTRLGVDYGVRFPAEEDRYPTGVS